MNQKRYAILIGNGKFQDPSFEDFESIDNDIDEFGKVLSSRYLCNFDEVTPMKNKTSLEIEQKIDEIIMKSDKDTLVLIYYSGHGRQMNGKLHLITSNTKNEILRSTSISIEKIKSLIDTPRLNKIIIILDCCWSGLAGKEFTRDNICDQFDLLSREVSGLYILTASTSAQQAFNSESENKGAFTKHIIEGIKSWDAADKDGNITPDSIYDYVYSRMRHDGKQTPMRWAIGIKGDLLISKSKKISSFRFSADAKESIYISFSNIIPHDTLWTDAGPWTLDSKPSHCDFASDRIAIPDDVTNEILEKIEDDYFLLIVGDKDCGKTWLSYILGDKILSTNYKTSIKRSAYYIQVSGGFSADEAIQELANISISKNNEEVYLFLDDCHLASAEVINFVDKILNEGEVYLRVVLLTRRDHFLLQELRESFEANKGAPLIIFDLNKKINYQQYNKKIFLNYLKSKNVNHKIDEEDIDNAANTWGSDLFWNWLRLKSWNYRNKDKLSTIGLDRVIRDLRRNDGEIRLDNPKRRRILQFLSFFCQFESLWVYKYIEFLENIENYCTLSELINEKIVVEYSTEQKNIPYVYLHQNLAELVLIALGIEHNEKLVQDEIAAIKNYVMSQSEPPNRFAVIACLHNALNTENSANAMTILRSIFSDRVFFDYMKDNIGSFQLSSMVSIIQCILFIENKQRWFQSELAKELQETYLDENADILKNKFTSARRTRANMRLLAHIVNLHDFFSQFDENDCAKLIINSNINSLRFLFFDIINYKLFSFGGMLADELSKVDISELLDKDPSCLYRFGGMIGNIEQINKSIAARFIEELSSYYNFSNLFLNAQFKSDTKKFSRIELINFFLTKRCTYSKIAAKKIIMGIERDIWGRIFEDSNDDREKIYLIWNIYIQSPETAKEIVKIGAGKYLPDEKPNNLDNRYFLPAIGIYHLCNIPIGEIDFNGHLDLIKRNLQITINKKEVSLVILYLISIKFLIGLPTFESIIKNIDNIMKKYIYETKYKFIENRRFTEELDEIINYMNKI